MNYEVDKIVFEENPTTKRTHKNIEKSLNFSLKNKYKFENNNELKEKSDKLLKIHGLRDVDFDIIGVCEKLFNEKLNDVSIDSNSNKNEKTIKGIMDEVVSSNYKAIGYDYLYQVMKEMYGKKEAKRLSGEMYDFSLAISDSTKILVPYCWAFDASKIVMFGRPFGQLQSLPPKRIGSYIAALSETIHQVSNHLAGAFAIATFFLDIAHILIYRENIKLDKLKNDEDCIKSIENEFQKFVHSVNHLSRSGAESPFTNLSVFDDLKLKAFLNKENYGWYFEGIEDENGKINEEYQKYLIDYIMTLQKIFLKFFDKGDPSKNGIPYRFPVITLNFSKKDDELENDNFINYTTENLDISRYNIFVSEGNKIASCCRLVSDSDMMNLADQVNSFGGGSSVSLGSHRVVTINLNRIALESLSLDNFYSILEARIEDSAKILLAHKNLIKKTVSQGLQPFIKNGWIDLKKMFSTFGIIGGYECARTLKNKFNIDNEEIFLKDLLIYFNSSVSKYSKLYKIIGNIEQIPAESMAVRLCESDKILFGENSVPYSLYSNQFIPLWENDSIWRRMELDGKYNKLITGGGIVHITIGEKVTSTQAKKIIKFAIDSGCVHFALNSVYSECINNHVSLGRFKTCPYCGEDIKEYYTRVVGFFTPVSSWNNVRRDWEFEKRIIVNGKNI